MRELSQWLLARLAERGVERVFGIPGVHTVPLYAGLAGSGIAHVTARHEQAAGFMADGWARVSGRPGVCFVITGPGLTNITTAMAQAYADSIPMLVLSSVSARRHLGRGLGQLHELANQQALAAQVSAFSHTLHALADFPAVLDRAFSVFSAARPRPVHIEIPLDLWHQAVPATTPAPAARAAPRPAAAPIAAAARQLAQAARPLILAGGGARHTADALVPLAERLDAPVVMSANGRGLLAPDHPLAVSASPSLDAVRALLADSDVTLAVGTELGPTDYDLYEQGTPTLGGSLIRLDIDPVQMTQPHPADIALLGDARTGLADLGAALPATLPQRAGARRAGDCRTASIAELDGPDRQALELLDTLRDALPSAILVGDSTHPVYAGNNGFAAASPGSWFNSATGYGTLGFALPAALGAALAAPQRPVICLIGDGGLHFTLGELASIREQRCPLIVLLWNNACYGEIKRAMQDQSVTPVGVDLFTPDFEPLAAAYDYAFAAPADLAALRDAVLRAARSARPTLLRVDEAHFIRRD